MDPDKVLLQRARALDERALAAIFDRYYVPLYRYIAQHTAHAETAEDLTSEVFRRMLEQFGDGRGPKEHLRAWLYRVAHNLIVDDARRGAHRQHAVLNEQLAAADDDVESAAGQDILVGDIREALQTLTPKQRSVILLKYVEGMSNAEAARVMGLPVGAVKSLQNRGLKALRRVLARDGWLFEEE